MDNASVDDPNSQETGDVEHSASSTVDPSHTDNGGNDTNIRDDNSHGSASVVSASAVNLSNADSSKAKPRKTPPPAVPQRRKERKERKPPKEVNESPAQKSLRYLEMQHGYLRKSRYYSSSQT